MASRRVTIARALVLLLVGMGIGVWIFVKAELDTGKITQRVQDALSEILAADFHFDRAEPNLDKGIEIHDLIIYYRDKKAALAIKQVSITLDWPKLLAGETVIRRVELEGITVRMRVGSDQVPTLPGLVRQRRQTSGPDMRFPVVVSSKRYPSYVILEQWPPRADALEVQVECRHLAFNPQGYRYELTAEFGGERVDKVELNGTWDAVEQELTVHTASIEGLSWTPEHARKLVRLLPGTPPPIEIGGEMDLELKKPIALKRWWQLKDVVATAELHDLNGHFGNLYTLEPDGMPFHVTKGSCKAWFENQTLVVKDLGATLAAGGPGGGTIVAEFSRDFSREPAIWEGFTLKGRGLYARPEHLAILLPPHIAKKVVPRFSPGGTFDCDLALTHRPFRPEKVHADVRLRGARFEFEQFRYPLSDCRGRIKVETNVSTPRGLCDIVDFELAHGPDVWDNPLAPPLPAVRVWGRSETFLRHDAENAEVQDIQVRVANLPFDEKLEKALESAEDGADLYRSFSLGGAAKEVEVHAIHDDFGERHTDTVYIIHLDGCSAAYEAFPLPLVDVKGTIIKRTTPSIEPATKQPFPLLELKVTGRARDGGRINAHGELRGEDLEVIVNAKGIVLGKDVERTIKTTAGKDVVDAWEKLEPKGKVAVEVHFDSREKDALNVWVDLAGSTDISGYGAFRYPVTGLQGTIFYRGNLLELQGVRGRLGAASFSADGYRDGPTGVFRVYGVFSGPVDEELWTRVDTLAGGDLPDDMRFVDGTRFRYDVRSNATDRQLQVELTELALRARWKGMKVRVDRGRCLIDRSQLRFEGMRITQDGARGWIEVVEGSVPFEEVERGPPPTVELRAGDLDPGTHLAILFDQDLKEFLGPDIRLDLPLFTVQYLEQDAAFRLNGTVDLHRLPGQTESPSGLGPTGILTLKNIVVVPDPPRGGPARLKGDVRLKDVNVTAGWAPRDMNGVLHIDDCHLGESFKLKGRVSEGEGKVLDFFAEDMRLDVTYELDTLLFKRIEGRFHEGTLQGEVSVHTTAPDAYHVHLNAKRVNLRKMLRPYVSRDEPMAGLLDFTIHLHSLSGHGYDQAGRIDVKVTEGQLFKIPGLRQLVSLLARVTPFEDSGGRFKEAVAKIRVEGETLHVDNIRLYTAVSDVYMHGTMSFFGDLDLVIKPQVTRIIDLPRLFNVPVLSALLNLWHKIAYEIRLEGTVGSPALRINGLPWLKKHRTPFIQTPHAGKIRRMRPRVLP